MGYALVEGMNRMTKEKGKTMNIPSYLLSETGCEKNFEPFCYGNHGDAVKQNPETGRWFITMGHPGFNSSANNMSGYADEKTARTAVKYYGRKK